VWGQHEANVPDECRSDKGFPCFQKLHCYWWALSATMVIHRAYFEPADFPKACRTGDGHAPLPEKRTSLPYIASYLWGTC
jgi:hypothetical protein